MKAPCICLSKRFAVLCAIVLLLAGSPATDVLAQDTTLIWQDTAYIKAKKRPQFLAFNGMGGVVLPTNAYVTRESRLPNYGAFALKYGVAASGDKWQDYAYGMPYYGIGLYSAHFFNKKALGAPISLLLFQGGTFTNFNPLFALKYELNLGMSFNWHSYDVFDNPDNIALGSSVNAHIGVNAYLSYRLSDKWDLNMGLGLSHFSNGAMQLPNKGLNMFAPFVEVVYNLNRCEERKKNDRSLIPPPLEDRIDYDILFTSTTRQIRIDTLGTGYPSRILSKNFKVFGLSYATMFVQSYKYKWGPSIELAYDESSGVKVWRQQHPGDGLFYDRVKLGDFQDRISLGISMKGELTFPYVSFFANLGYNLIHGNEYDYRFYQIMGAKGYISENIFGTFGIRANRFSKAQYLFWSIGYTIKGRSLQKKEKYIHRILP